MYFHVQNTCKTSLFLYFLIWHIHHSVDLFPLNYFFKIILRRDFELEDKSKINQDTAYFTVRGLSLGTASLTFTASATGRGKATSDPKDIQVCQSVIMCSIKLFAFPYHWCRFLLDVVRLDWPTTRLDFMRELGWSPVGWLASVWMPSGDMWINCDHLIERYELTQIRTVGRATIWCS